jgi:protocatechuate 3,4-dioxygenase beta subunit
MKISPLQMNLHAKSRNGGTPSESAFKVFAPDGREILTTQLYLPGISDQIPDAISDASLLTHGESPDPSGRRHISFDFIVEP